MKMNTYLVIGMVILIVSSHTLLIAVPVTIDEAGDAANFHLLVKEKSDNYSVNEMHELKNSEDITISFIANLNPFGFIAISTDTDITPIISYSFHGNFPYDDDENNILYHMLKNDMELRLQAISETTYPKILLNNQLWDVYLCEDLSYLNRNFQQWPPEGSTITGGWVQTTWTQNPPYNNACPLDPDSQRCHTGCAATSMSQIINYHCGYFGDRTFEDSDDYISDHTDPNIIIDDNHDEYDFPSFPELNMSLSTMEYDYRYNIQTDWDKAILNFASGVLLKMKYTCQVSQTIESLSDVLVHDLSYEDADEVTFENNPNFFVDLQNNIIDSFPAELIIINQLQTLAHSVVCDGYNTDNEYHINYGWGTFGPEYICHTWYSLPDGLPVEYPILWGATINIIPPKGTLQGNVELIGGSGNIEEVILVIGNKEFHVGSNGEFSINLPSKYQAEPPDPRIYDILATLYGYEDSIVENVEIYEDMVTNLSITLNEYIPNIIHVPNDYPTIQQAIDNSYDSDSILVEPGTYFENIDFKGKRVTVCSRFVTDNDESFIENTIINGNQDGTVVTFTNQEDTLSVLKGFTVMNGSNLENGAGIYIYKSSPKLENLIISNNYSENYAGGIECNNSSAMIRKCIISSNEGHFGIDCRDYSYPIIEHTYIVNNHSLLRETIGIHCGHSSPEFINVTISNNRVNGCTQGAGLYLINNSGPNLVNCIIWNNTQQSIYQGTGCDVTITFSDIEDGWFGEGNIDIDPAFVDPSSADYSLSQESPCIDSGDPNSDLDPDGTRVDMGPFTATLEIYELSSEEINWCSFPVLNPNNIDAYDFFEQLILNGSLREVRYTNTEKLYYDEFQNVWINDIGNLRTVDGYRVDMYETDFISLYGYKVPPETQIDLIVEEDKAPEFYPIGYHNWIGYFLPYSQSPQDAFAHVWDNLTFIKADDYTLRRKWNSDEWWGETSGPVSVDYGKSYAVGVLEDCSFIWNQSPFHIEEYNKTETVLFTYEETMDYMPIFVDSTETLNSIDEIGVFLEDECIGASVVEGYPVFIPAYVEDDSTLNKDCNELTFQVACYDKDGRSNISVYLYDEVKNIYMEEPVVLNKNSYAIVRLGSAGNTNSSVGFELYQNYPNPVVSKTTISFTVHKDYGDTEIKIYNIKGQLVKQLGFSDADVGFNAVWDCTDNHNKPVSNGIYFYKVTFDKYSELKKMIIIR